jgi:uncharacterized protein (TIGR02646 family)
VRNIAKQREPRGLVEYRLAGGAFENYPAKQDLRERLCNEQKGLCCYCMNRIRPTYDGMKIEHWRPQSDYPDEALAYGNLLGACDGGRQQPIRQQHCDTFKGNRKLSRNPARDAVEERISYAPDGTIRSEDAMLNLELDEVLNLNTPLLKNQREAAVDVIARAWRMTDWRARDAMVQRNLARLEAKDPLSPFEPVHISWLKKRGARRS